MQFHLWCEKQGAGTQTYLEAEVLGMPIVIIFFGLAGLTFIPKIKPLYWRFWLADKN